MGADGRRFDGKVVVITGASTGIGYATALRCAEEGAKIVAAGRRQEKLDSAAQQIKEAVPGAQVITVAADVGTEQGNKDVVEAAQSNFGRLDAFFANAGIFSRKSLLEVEEADIDHLYTTNVKGVIFGIKHAMRAMKDADIKGSIVVNSSCVSSLVKKEHTGSSLYSSTKSAVDMLVKHAALEGAEYGIRANTVNPGIIYTGILGEEVTEDAFNEFAKPLQTMGRAGASKEVAALSAFLLSDESSFITGSHHSVDGGWAIC